MMQAVNKYASIWTWGWIRKYPVRSLGIVLHLVLRTLFGIFWLSAGINKINKDWLTTDILKQIFLDRLTEMPPDSFAVLYLQAFAIPLYQLVAWVVTFGELYAAIGLLFGITTRWAAWMSLGSCACRQSIARSKNSKSAAAVLCPSVGAFDD